MSDKTQKPPYPLRMSDEMRADLEKAAKNAGRSLNAEIVARLEKSFQFKSLADEVIENTAAQERYFNKIEKAYRGMTRVRNSLLKIAIKIISDAIDVMKRHDVPAKEIKWFEQTVGDLSKNFRELNDEEELQAAKQEPDK